jgi:hypothetical protein
MHLYIIVPSALLRLEKLSELFLCVRPFAMELIGVLVDGAGTRITVRCVSVGRAGREGMGSIVRHLGGVVVNMMRIE